jgi:hypothetical protein
VAAPEGTSTAAPLRINTPGDAYEREAERAASAYGVTTVAGAPFTSGQVSRLQRCACGGGAPEGECEECAKALQRSAAAPAPASPDGALAPAVVHDVLRAPGEPLDPGVRGRMEHHFGVDFGHVRVHTGARAEESARAVRANAYTVGSHVVFDAGRYQPGAARGQRLLAHELAHVVQQGRRAGLPLQRDDKAPAPTGGQAQAGAATDVAIVLGDEADAMVEARTYAPVVIRVTSGADAAAKLKALNRPINTIFVVSHSTQAGQVQVISGIGTIAWVKLSDFSKDLKGALPPNQAPKEVDFRGCKLGESPGQMETFRQNVGAQSARATNCWSIISTASPLTAPDGSDITKPSDVPKGQEANVDQALRTQINNLTSADGRRVKDCMIGLAKGETADKQFAKIKQLYFKNAGNLAAGWASPVYDYTWQKDSICVKDMTATTTPCKVVTVAAPAPGSGGGSKKSALLMEPVPGARLDAVADTPTSADAEEALA